MVGDRYLACYDGAANMTGKFSGVRTRIQTEILEAYYVHCYAHCLNLAVVKSCQLPIVRNTIDTVKDVSKGWIMPNCIEAHIQ
jgi:hypothetical protein